MAKFLSPDSRSDWKLSHTERGERFIFHDATQILLHELKLNQEVAARPEIHLRDAELFCKQEICQRH